MLEQPPRLLLLRVPPALGHCHTPATTSLPLPILGVTCTLGGCRGTSRTVSCDSHPVPARKCPMCLDSLSPSPNPTSTRPLRPTNDPSSSFQGTEVCDSEVCRGSKTGSKPFFSSFFSTVGPGLVCNHPGVALDSYFGCSDSSKQYLHGDSLSVFGTVTDLSAHK